MIIVTDCGGFDIVTYCDGSDIVTDCGAFDNCDRLWWF